MNEKKWHVLPAIIATAILSFAGVLVETSMNVTFPTLMKEFGVGATAVQWVTTGNLLAVAIIVPLSAYLIKHFSERAIFIASNVFFLSGVLVDSFAPHLAILLLGRILQGIGTGISLPLMLHIIMNRVPKERRGFIMGLANMTTSFAPAIGPTYGGLVLGHFGWKAIFLFLLPVLIMSILVGLWAIPQEQVTNSGSFNLLAFIFLGFGLASLLLAIEQMSIVWLILALVSLFVFYLVNRKLPLLNLNVFANRPYVLIMGMVLASQMLALGLSFILPNHLQIVLGKTSTFAGLFMFPGAILVALVLPISGKIMDKIGAAKPIILGVFLSFLGLVTMAALFHQASSFVLLICDVLALLGVGIATGNAMTVCLSKLPQVHSADGNGILSTLQQFAGALSTTLVSQLFSLGQATNDAVSGGRNGVLLLATILCLSLLTAVYLYRRQELTID